MSTPPQHMSRARYAAGTWLLVAFGICLTGFGLLCFVLAVVIYNS